MKNLPRFLFRCSLFAFAPIAANAAGTYYTGNYQSPQQQRYNTTAYSSPRAGYNTNGYNNYNNANSSVRYNAGGNWGGAQQQPQTSRAQRTTQNQTKDKPLCRNTCMRKMQRHHGLGSRGIKLLPELRTETGLE